MIGCEARTVPLCKEFWGTAPLLGTFNLATDANWSNQTQSAWNIQIMRVHGRSISHCFKRTKTYVLPTISSPSVSPARLHCFRISFRHFLRPHSARNIRPLFAAGIVVTQNVLMFIAVNAPISFSITDMALFVFNFVRSKMIE